MSFYQNQYSPLYTPNGAASSYTTLSNTLSSTAGGSQSEEPTQCMVDNFPTPASQCESSIVFPQAETYSYRYASNDGGPPYSHMLPPQSTTWTGVQSGTDNSVLLGHQVSMFNTPTVGYWGAPAQMLQSQPSCHDEPSEVG